MEQNNVQNIKKSKEEFKEGAKGLLHNLKVFLKELLDFREDTDYQSTLDAIKEDIPFKGATAWILIFAVFVASIGLNSNSTAVVIGAMLISPLMGPILGIGMAFAVNDGDTYKKSAVSLVTMIVLSIITSFLFFYFFPLSEDTSELIGRTKPDIRDVLIAFFGGLALMVARTKKGTIASVIFGVAIATALMPPLCTVGYGLAKWAGGDWKGFRYAYMAMYLFTINTIFICLATFLVLKLLRFPMYKYANAARRKRYSTIATIVGLAAMVPAVYTFFTALSDARIKNQINHFIKNEIETIDTFQLIEKQYLDDEKVLSLNFFNEVTEADKKMLKNQWDNDPRYNYLKEVELRIKGSNTKSFDLITTAYKDKQEELKESKNIIAGLQMEIKDLEKTITDLNYQIEKDALSKNSKSILFSSIAKDAKIRYTNIEEIAYSKELYSKDFIKIDTLNIISVKWNKRLKDTVVKQRQLDLSKWLKQTTKVNDLIVRRRK